MYVHDRELFEQGSDSLGWLRPRPLSSSLSHPTLKPPLAVMEPR